MGTVLKP